MMTTEEKVKKLVEDLDNARETLSTQLGSIDPSTLTNEELDMLIGDLRKLLSQADDVYEYIQERMNEENS